MIVRNHDIWEDGDSLFGMSARLSTRRLSRQESVSLVSTRSMDTCGGDDVALRKCLIKKGKCKIGEDNIHGLLEATVFAKPFEDAAFHSHWLARVHPNKQMTLVQENNSYQRIPDQKRRPSNDASQFAADDDISEDGVNAGVKIGQKKSATEDDVHPTIDLKMSTRGRVLKRRKLD